MTTNKPQDPKYRTRESMSRLYKQLAEMENQRDALLAACREAADALELAASDIGCAAQCASDCDDADRVRESAKKVRSAIAACGETAE